MAAAHQRTRSYKGRHRKPARPQRIVVPVVTLAALSVGGVAAANALNNNSGHPAAGSVVAHQPRIAAPVIRTTQAAVSAPSTLTRSASKPVIHRAVHHHARPHLGPHSLMVRDVYAPCYVQITTGSGKVLVQRIMQRGQLVAFRRHGLDVTLGNAGGVRVAINGHHAHRGGASGQVRTFRVR